MCNACNEHMLRFLRSVSSRRDVLRHAGAMAAVALAPSVDAVAQPVAGPAGGADKIFTGRNIQTMEPTAPRVEAIAVRGGRIVALGSAANVMKLRTPATELVDFADAPVFPGFVDPHMHSSFTALRPWQDIGPFAVPDMAGAKARLREAAGKAAPDEWILGKMLDPSIMPGPPITRADLDAIAPNNPMFILESNGHIAYANSKALGLAGITRDTADPPQGRYIRDSAGELTGRLEESPAFGRLIAVIPRLTAQQMVGFLRADLMDAAARGCTAVHDCGIGTVFAEQDLALIDAVMQTSPPLRYAGYLVSTHFDTWARLGLKPGPRSSRFSLNGIKAWADGSNQAQTGYQRAPYLGSQARGSLNYTGDAIADAIGRAHRAGWQVGIHANGDAAIDTVLDAFETGTGGEGGHVLRHRIEHCSVLHKDQIARMKRLGLSPSFLIGHVHFWGAAFEERLLGPERAARIDPCRDALAAGLRISLHSDFNVTPIDPLRCVQNAVVRDMKENGRILAPDQRISVMEGLRAVTIDAAWQCHLDHLCGSLAPGKAADFVVLEQDPLQVRPEAIAAIRVKATWIDGERGYAA